MLSTIVSVQSFGSVWPNTHRSETCLDTVVSFFYQGERGRNPGGVHFLPPFEGRQRIEGSGYTKFGSGMPVQMRCKTRLVGTQNGGRTFVNAATYAKDVKRGCFDPVHHLLFGSSQRPRRRRILWVVSRGVLWGVAVRQNAFIELQRAFVWHMSPGARLLEVSILQTSTGTGTHLWLLG